MHSEREEGLCWEDVRDWAPAARDAEAVVLAAGRAGHERLLGVDLDPLVSDRWSREDDDHLAILARWPLAEAEAALCPLDDAQRVGLEDRGRKWLSTIRSLATELVRARWSDIQRVARALMEAPGHGLSGDEVRSVVGHSQSGALVKAVDRPS